MRSLARAVAVAGLILGAMGGMGCEEANRFNLPPVATVAIEPTGLAITRATAVRFRAVGVDADNDVITYRWDFGDLTVGEGPDVSHVFPTVGTFRVTLTVTDNLDENRLVFNVPVNNLVGSWEIAQRPGLRGEVSFELTQSNPRIAGRVFIDRGFIIDLDATRSTVTDPRRVTLAFTDATGRCDLVFRGEASADLRTISGTTTCSLCSICDGQSQPALLVKTDPS
jgi:PKD domain-containing protein